MKTPKARKLDSGSWFCRVMVDGKTFCVTKDTEKAAIAEAMAIKAGMKAANKTESITLSKAIDRYIEDRSSILSPATIRGYRTVQGNRLQSLMKLQVSKIDTKAVQKAVNEDAKTVGAKTIKNALGLVSGVLGYYNVEIGKLTLPEQKKTEKQIYTREELCILLDAIRETDVEIVVLLALWLGLRRSEILGLRWNAIDTKRGTVAITEAKVPDENNQFVTKGTKTAASARVLSCPQYILDVLERWPRSGEYVVNMYPDKIRRHLNKICENAGIPNIGLHALRHQNASTMLLLNVPDKYVMERGGWSNIQTPKTIYQHTMAEGRDDATRAINQYFNDIVSPQNGNGER